MLDGRAAPGLLCLRRHRRVAVVTERLVVHAEGFVLRREQQDRAGNFFRERVIENSKTPFRDTRAGAGMPRGPSVVELKRNIVKNST